MLIDIYRKGWALRYLREAIDEIKMAKKDSRAFGLAIEALRKAQTAVYYSLGEPLFIERVVEEALEEKTLPENPILRCLVDIERSIKRLESMQEMADRSDLIIKESDRIISIASKIVNLLASGD